MAVYHLNKRLGETPLQALSRLRIEQNLPDDLPITFAGRLDPAATGEMIFLSGDDILQKDSYLHAEKVYEVKFILGLSTDTGDLLGLVTEYKPSQKVSELQLIATFESLVGKRQQKFHPFSSKVIDGKPLWQHAREGNDAEASHEVTFHGIELLSSEVISAESVLQKVSEITSLVSGDFRQSEILQSWEPYKHLPDKLQTVTVRIHSSSGAYMRVLGEELGAIIQTPVCAYSIERREIIVPI